MLSLGEEEWQVLRPVHPAAVGVADAAVGVSGGGVVNGGGDAIAMAADVTHQECVCNDRMLHS